MVWDPKTKLLSPQFHAMFEDNFDTVQAPDPNVRITDTIDRLFKTNKYKYDDTFGNEQTYLFSYEGVDIHPYNLSPNIKTCQESITMTSTCDKKHCTTSNKSSDENTNNNRSIPSMHDPIIIHANSIFPQNSKDDFQAYKQLHGIDMKIHSIPKPPKQNVQDMGLFDLYVEEFRLIAME
jgi:hypothetical protein